MPARRTIGVDLGGTKLLAGAVDSGHGVHCRAQRTVSGLDQASLLDVAVDAVSEARESAGAEVAAVGFGIPCLLDRRTGEAVIAVNLPLADIAFADVMAERLDLPVFVDNDGNVAALAEHRAGAARGCSEAVVMTIGTGIGGGLPCQGNWPNQGCVEAMASGTALAREAARIASEEPNSRLARAREEGRELAGPLVTELAHDGDHAAVRAIALIGSRLGVAITSLVNIFNPEVVVIGGGVIAAGELLLEPARAVVAERALPPSRDEVRIVPARFGVEAGMIGAAALASDGLEGKLR
jgi:glucokinase